MTPPAFGPIRFGHGDLGGRARGLDFLARELGESLLRAYHPHRVVIDQPLVICSDVFERTRHPQQNGIQPSAKFTAAMAKRSLSFLRYAISEGKIYKKNETMINILIKT